MAGSEQKQRTKTLGCRRPRMGRSLTAGDSRIGKATSMPRFRMTRSEQRTVS
jgi:hypothetical protein